MLETSIPARLDRLPRSAWHGRVVIALGVTWLLDGLEVTVVGSLGPALYGAIIETGSRDTLFAAYALAGVLMCAAAAVAAWIGVDAERRSLAQACPPLGCDLPA